MIKEAILITNDEFIIKENKMSIYIENSLCLGKELFSKYNYIIIDYDTLILEKEIFEQLKEHHHKVLILGEGYIDNLRSISKNEFHTENIDIYYGQDKKIEISCEDKLDEALSLEIDHIINLYIDTNTLVREVSRELTQASKAVKREAYKLIDIIDKGSKLKKLKWFDPIRINFILEKRKNFK